jgi:hypothetical protein
VIERLKFLLQPVAIERDDDGKIVREMPAEVITVYSAEQAALAVTEFEAALAEMAAQANGIPPKRARVKA